MKREIVETGLTVAVLVGITGFFFYQNNQKEMARLPAYEGKEEAIAYPVNLADTKFKVCQVTKVSDGDTIAVDCDEGKLKLRFCGIDAPESKQPLGMESKALMIKLVQDKQVIVRPIEKDRYDRTVAQVEVKSGKLNVEGKPEYILVNAEMVRSGMAYHYAQYSRNCFDRDEIIKAEKEAKDKKLGVWDGGNYQKPWDFRRASK